MALSVTWNSNFETRPPYGISRSSMDDEMRLMRKMVRQVMSQEHHFGYGTDDDGRHREGYVTLFGVGDSTARDAVSGMPDGALWLLDDGTNYRLQAYKESTTSWVTVAYPDHGALVALTDSDAHPEFLLKTGGVMTRPVSAQSGPARVPDAEDDEDVAILGRATNYHNSVGHPGTIDAILSSSGLGTVPLAKVAKLANVTAEVDITVTDDFSDTINIKVFAVSDVLSSTITVNSGDFDFGSDDTRFIVPTGVTVSGNFTFVTYYGNAVVAASLPNNVTKVNKNGEGSWPNHDMFAVVFPLALPVNGSLSPNMRVGVLFSIPGPEEINGTVTLSVTYDVYGYY